MRANGEKRGGAQGTDGFHSVEQHIEGGSERRAARNIEGHLALAGEFLTNGVKMETDEHNSIKLKATSKNSEPGFRPVNLCIA